MPSPTPPIPRRLRAALLAVLLALAATALAAVPASAGTVQNVSVDYETTQATREAGAVSTYLRVSFRPQTDLVPGQTITLAGPAGGDLSHPGVQLDVNGGGFPVSRRLLSNGNSTLALTIPGTGTIAAGTRVEVSLREVRNPNVAGRYRWSVTTTTDATPGQSPEYEIVAGTDPARLATTGSWSTNIPAATEQLDAVEVRTTDLGGNPVRPAAPVDVTFTVEPGVAAATFPNGASSVVVRSDADGLASAPRLTAGTRAGPVAVTATAAELGSASFPLSVQAGPARRLDVADVEPALVSAAQPQLLAVEATVVDQYGNVIGGDAGMTVEASGGHEVWDLDFVEAQGIWRAQLVSSRTVGRFAVTFRYGLLSGSATFDQALAPLLGGPAVTPTHDGASIALGVDPQNAETTYRVEYGAETADELRSAPAVLARGVGPQAVRVALAGLRPTTTYVYRVVAENAIGETAGPVRTFATAATPPPDGGDGDGGDRGGGGDRPADPPRPGDGGRPGDGSRPGDEGRAPVPPPAAPVLTQLRPDARAFAARRGARGAPTVRFRLSADARVQLVVETRVGGVRAGRGRVPARRGRRGRPCAAWARRGAWRVAGRAGANAVTLEGGALRRGSYRVVATPAGGSAVTARFAVRR